MPDAFTAMADPTRRQILRLLAGGQMAAGDVAAAFPQQRPAISKHLTILKRAGLIDETRHRQQRLYAIRSGALEGVLGFLSALVHRGQPLGAPRSRPVTTVTHSPLPTRPSLFSAPLQTAPVRPAFDLDFD